MSQKCTVLSASVFSPVAFEICATVVVGASNPDEYFEIIYDKH
jgi:hypothetical protein